MGVSSESVSSREGGGMASDVPPCACLLCSSCLRFVVRRSASCAMGVSSSSSSSLFALLLLREGGGMESDVPPRVCLFDVWRAVGGRCSSLFSAPWRVVAAHRAVLRVVVVV